MDKSVKEINIKDVNILLDKAYEKYCDGDDHCYVTTCPINALMMNVAVYMQMNNPLLLYGSYKILEDLAEEDV